jgi:hypothetical protein
MIYCCLLFSWSGARALLADPGDLAIADIQEFIALSSALQERYRKEREDALARDEARVAEIKAGQERTARLQRIARWAFVAVGAVILIAGATIGYLQADKARQLAKEEAALTAEQASNASLTSRLTDGRSNSTTPKPTFSLNFPRPNCRAEKLMARSGWHCVARALTLVCLRIPSRLHRPLPRLPPLFRRRIGVLRSVAMMAQ